MAKPSLLFNTLATGTGTKENEVDAARRQLLIHWREHPWNWLTGKDLDGRPIVWTKDERDDKAPIKPFPGHKEYLRHFVNTLFDDANRLIAVDKCRQMYVSTVSLAVLDWWCRFRAHRSVVVSKLTEEQATKLINDKCRDGIHANLPKWVQAVVPQDDAPARTIRYPRNTIGGGGSSIEAVAQNAAVGAVRGGTISIMLVDEAAFQDETDEIIDSALPAATRLWVVSSPFLGTRGGVTFKELIDQGKKEATA